MDEPVIYHPNRDSAEAKATKAIVVLLLLVSAALVLIVFRLLFTPDLDSSAIDIDVDLGRKIGVFLGLIAAAGIAYGGWRATQESATTSPTPDPVPAPPQQ